MQKQRRPWLFGHLAPALTCGVCLLLGSPAAAQCFCLAHPITGIVHYGCEAHTIPNRVSELVSCLNPERTARTRITDSANFTRIPAGEGMCNPCSPPPDVNLPEIPRKP